MAQSVGEASRAGQKLAKLGAEKGGRARANTLTPAERSEIARNAVRARWAKAGKLKPSPDNNESLLDPIQSLG